MATPPSSPTSAARRDLLRREVLVVLRQPRIQHAGTDAPARLHRRAAEAATRARRGRGHPRRSRRSRRGDMPGSRSRPGRRAATGRARRRCALYGTERAHHPRPPARRGDLAMSSLLVSHPTTRRSARLAVRSRRHRGPPPGPASRGRLVRQLRRHRLPARGGAGLAGAAHRPPQPPRRRRARRARPGQHRRRAPPPPARPSRIRATGRRSQRAPGRPRRRGRRRGRPRPRRRAGPG